MAPSLLSCPLCRQLIHSAELESLAERARTAEAGGDVRDALVAWRRALELLPPGTRQSDAVQEHVDRLGRALESTSSAARAPEAVHDRGRLGALLGGAGGLGLLLWKFKFVLGFVATKGKLLLLGLTKSSTLFSMVISAGLYWSVWGWAFGVGLVLLIYVHEIGHVAALTRLGIAASAPMFIPGLGALVRMNQYPASPREDARVGLAGPLWGLAGAALAIAAGLALDLPLLTAIGRFGAWINVFNLLPVWHLDGARGFRALSRDQRWICAGVMLLCWAATEESLFVLLALGAAYHALSQPPPRESDRRALAELLGLLVVGAALCAVPVALPGPI